MGCDLQGTVVPFGREAPFGHWRATGLPYPADEMPMQRSLRTGSRTVGERLSVHNPVTGRDVPLMSSSAPLTDGQGHIVGAVVVFQDVSRLIELERQRDEWTSIIAHDLRQPATIVRGYLELVLRQLARKPDLEREKQYLAHAHAAASNLSKMIADLLDVSRIETSRLQIKPRDVDLAKLVRDVAERMAAITLPHPVEVRVSDEIPIVPADPERIEQVLGNLLSNAAKYSYPDSEIVVSVRSEAGGAVVSVANRGEGIAPEDHELLFERFYRARLARVGDITGLGLGLYITRRLIEAHRGRIWVESDPGGWTTFSFWLPTTADRSGNQERRA
jgi:signal transduction histidine kinase